VDRFSQTNTKRINGPFYTYRRIRYYISPAETLRFMTVVSHIPFTHSVGPPHRQLFNPH